MMVLKDPNTIKHKIRYDKMVKCTFNNNVMLVNKWIRYGDTMRGSEYRE
jgi:hypothetical protein